MKKFFLTLVFVFCLMNFSFCYAGSHSGEIFFYSGVADEVYGNNGRTLNWYVREPSISLNDEKNQAGAMLYAHDENDKLVLSHIAIFNVVVSKKNPNKYRIIKRILVYEEYLRNNRKFYEYVKKDTMAGALVTVMQRYIDFGKMIPVDIEKERNPFAMMDREREFNRYR